MVKLAVVGCRQLDSPPQMTLMRATCATAKPGGTIIVQHRRSERLGELDVEVVGYSKSRALHF